jgi:hypothetical protein
MHTKQNQENINHKVIFSKLHNDHSNIFLGNRNYTNNKLTALRPNIALMVMTESEH